MSGLLRRGKKKAFSKLFAKAQIIYRYSFPREERYHGHSIRAWLRGEAYGENRPSATHYLVSKIGEKVNGMVNYDIIADDKEDALIFLSYIATAKSMRGKGVGKKLVHGMMSYVGGHCEKEGKIPKVLIAEVEKPNIDEMNELNPYLKKGEPIPKELYEMYMRNVIRPNFHHHNTRLAAMATVDNQGFPKLVYYTMPDLSIDDEWKAPVEMLATIALVGEDKELIPCNVKPGSVISEEGKLKIDVDKLPNIEVDAALRVIRAVSELYLEYVDSKFTENITGMYTDIINSIKSATDGKIYLIPIKDTMWLKFEK